MAETKTTKKTVKKTVSKPTVKKTVAKETTVLNATPAAKSVKEKTAAARNTVSVDVIGVDGKVTEKISLPGYIFAATVNPKLMAQAVRVYLSNQRRGTVSTLTRGEVDGSTRKIYRQKGTGRARHGSVRAPIFVGGGLVFGPKQRDYSLKLPQKMRRAALFSALTIKLKDNEMVVLNGLESLEPKTKAMYSALKTYLADKNPSVLFIVPTESSAESVKRAVRNIEGVTFLPVNQLNTYEVLKAKKVIFMKDAASSVAQIFGKENA